MKTKISFPNLVFTATMVVGLITACAPQPNAQNPDKPVPTQVNVVEEATLEPDPTPIIPPTESTLSQFTQTINGVALTAANFRFEQNQLMIDTCFDLPDNGDWSIWEVTLKLGDQERKGSGGVPMEIPLETTSQKEQRCDTIYFEGLSTETDFTNATFIVDWILAYPREGEECSSEYLAKYQKALDARNTGITVECFIEELKDGGMSGIRVANKPDSMGQEEAEAMIHNYDFFMELHGIQGPWIFTFSLK